MIKKKLKSDLINRIKSNDQKAINEFTKVYTGFVKGIIFNSSTKHKIEEPEEIINDALLITIEKIKQYEKIFSVEGLIRIITKRLILKIKIHPIQEIDESKHADPFDTERSYINMERIEKIIEHCFKKLSPTQQTVVELTLIKNMSQVEIAKERKVTKEAINQMLHNSIYRLKLCVSEKGIS